MRQAIISSTVLPERGLGSGGCSEKETPKSARCVEAVIQKGLSGLKPLRVLFIIYFSSLSQISLAIIS